MTPEGRNFVVASSTRPTTSIGTVGHKWIANVAAPGLCGKCRTMRWNQQQRGHHSAAEPAAAHTEGAPQPPGEILRSPPAHADLVLGQPAAPRASARSAGGWLTTCGRASVWSSAAGGGPKTLLALVRHRYQDEGDGEAVRTTDPDHK
jgi:hypothetical protein